MSLRGPQGRGNPFWLSLFVRRDAHQRLLSLIYVHTIISVEITFDPAKDDANCAKPGVSLAMAEDLEWDGLLAKPDARRDYGEARMIGYALIGARLHCVVYSDRGDERRIISLRRANSRGETLCF